MLLPTFTLVKMQHFGTFAGQDVERKPGCSRVVNVETHVVPTQHSKVVTTHIEYFKSQRSNLYSTSDNKSGYIVIA